MLLFLVFYTTGRWSTLAGIGAVPMVDYNEDCIRSFNLLEPHRNPILSASPPLLSPPKKSSQRAGFSTAADLLQYIFVLQKRC